MTLKEEITETMTRLGRGSKALFIGYNTKFGSRMYGTLEKVADEKIVETGIVEDLMVSMAIGAALEGYRPVVCFERHDFLLLALDALVNHLDKLAWMSGGQYKLPVLVRAIVGSKKPINPGPQHTQDYTKELASMLKYTEVHKIKKAGDYQRALEAVGNTISGAVVAVEWRDLYNYRI